MSADLEVTGERSGLHLSQIIHQMKVGMGEKVGPVESDTQPDLRLIEGFLYETALEYMHGGVPYDQAMDMAFKRYMMKVREDVSTQLHIEKDGIKMTPDGFNEVAGELESYKLTRRTFRKAKTQQLFEENYWAWLTQEKAYCVPTTYRILTDTGWKRHSEIRVGETVLGYNSFTRTCEWTTVHAINRPGRQTVMNYKNSRFSVECTQDHKWMFVPRRGNGPRLRTIESLKYTSEWKILRAARSEDGPGTDRDEYNHLLDRGNCVGSVLKMTSGERRSFIYGMLLGEGSVSYTTIGFAQNAGPVMDGFRLACFLEGIPTCRPKPKSGSDCLHVNLFQRPYVDARLSCAGSRVCDVWCPTTGLGTWIMQSDEGEISITGNCLALGVDTARWYVLFQAGDYGKGVGTGPICMTCQCVFTVDELRENWYRVLEVAGRMRDDSGHSY